MEINIDPSKILRTFKDDLKFISLGNMPDDFKVNSLPIGIKILLENVLRRFINNKATEADLLAFKSWGKDGQNHEIGFSPERVLMQDLTGIPAVVDLACLREAVNELGGDPKSVDPLVPVELIVDHSVIVDYWGNNDAFQKNVELEYQRNKERLELLKWAQLAFEKLKVVPPGTGICHQVNLEYLARVVIKENDLCFFDTLVGTDSHTTMVNGLGVLGWGVGGIEAEAAMLKEPISMSLPEVVGIKLSGELEAGTTATDLVLAITELLRKVNVVGKFVEFFGPSVDKLSVEMRATISNMSPEFGATCALFPVDIKTLEYLELTGRSYEHIDLVEAYCKAQGVFHDEDYKEPNYSQILEVNLQQVVPSVAGPSRPQDRIELSQVKQRLSQVAGIDVVQVEQKNQQLKNFDVVIAAITSCTNTSNPYVLIAAGLLAKKACELGLEKAKWVKASLAPGSRVVIDYLENANLLPYLEKLGFYLVGFGCTTCIGNSGPLDPEVSKAINENNLIVCSVLSGNRNFEGRIHPEVKFNFLASPPLVVAYAIAGTMAIDLTKEPLRKCSDGNDVYLKDIWPSIEEVQEILNANLSRELFQARYSEVYKGDKRWESLSVKPTVFFNWDDNSTYVRKAPFLNGIKGEPEKIKPIKNARVLAFLGDSVTTDHISPAGSIKVDSPAGSYLKAMGVAFEDFNTYGTRRGNHEVMVRGTLANIRLKNKLVSPKEGGYTRYFKSGEIMTIFDAAQKYKEDNIDLVILAGKEYGSGSSRDWAAKGVYMLGVRAVIAESFERIHRSNLVEMGILPLQLLPGDTFESLSVTGEELINIDGMDKISPQFIPETLTVHFDDKEVTTVLRIDTAQEAQYFIHGGILPYVARSLVTLTRK